ncbi:MAG: hypothetical protein LBB89_03680 [Treponema sp.]|jgi:hypothetical protein|nr:hypothetical protein [Treponema sp.]
MQINPVDVIGEILGEPSALRRNPVNLDYLCPFINSQCTKRSQKLSGPYPICSVFHGKDKKLMCICPKRFLQADFKQKILDVCWPGERPKNPIIVHEIKMENFGNVDFVIADVDEKKQHVRQFLSVELQAVDITGSVEPVYQAIINSEQTMSKNFSYGINWENVRKRYITQLINKGFFHHHWQSKIIAVIQLALYNNLREKIRFDELEPKSDTSNIVFMLYDFKKIEGNGSYYYEITYKKAIGTSHSSLMNAALYKTPPSKEKFEERILSVLNKK